MNAKFIFWQNIEFINKDSNYGYLSHDERDILKHIIQRNTVRQVPFPEDSKAIKSIVEVINQRLAETRREVHGLY
jgi:hypothetical protein